MAFRVRITGGEKIAKNVEYLRREFPEFLNAANLETGAEILDLARRNVKQLDAFDTGDLHNSLDMSVSPKRLFVSVYSSEPYAPYIEFGTRPHFPPLEPIREWCRHKGIPESAAFPIAKKIAEIGTPERPFLYPAYKQGSRDHVTRIRKLYKMAMRGLL